MKFFFLLMTLGFLSTACNNGEDKAGAIGSGAGIEREEEYNDSDANITTPIESEEEDKNQ